MINNMFEYVTPESCGIRSSRIMKLIGEICKLDRFQELDGFRIIRHGKILAEGYFAPYRKEYKHTLCSVSKAFISTAIGFAVDEGLLQVEDKVVRFFPEKAKNVTDSDMLNMTIHHLLTMTSGKKGVGVHERDDSIIDCKDQVQTFIDLPFDAKPGDKFDYIGFCTYMLSAILTRVTGKNPVDYLNDKLFSKIGMEYPTYRTCPGGIFLGYSGMRITLDDFSRFGQFYLQKGEWNGQQLLSKAWIKKATSKQIDTNVGTGIDWTEGYAYQFWRGRHNTYRFCGANAQTCIVSPDKDMMFVMLSNLDNSHIQTMISAFYDCILNDASPEALPENPADYATLNELMSNLTLQQIYSSNAPIEALVSGKVMKCTQGAVGSIKIDFSGDQGVMEVVMDNGGILVVPFGRKEPVSSIPGDIYNFCSMDTLDESVYSSTGYWKTQHTFCVDCRLLNTMTEVTFEIDYGKNAVICKTYRGKLDEVEFVGAIMQ